MDRTIRSIVVAAGALAGWLALAASAQAHGRVQWSVTVGSPGYVVPQGVVVVPQPQYIYGPPPSAFAPPPNVIYVQPAYPVYPPPVTYVDPYGRPVYPRHEHRHHGGNDWGDGHRGGHWRR
jgi:hypothetical protein